LKPDPADTARLSGISANYFPAALIPTTYRNTNTPITANAITIARYINSGPFTQGDMIGALSGVFSESGSGL
jgi:hypothetical protein